MVEHKREPTTNILTLNCYGVKRGLYRFEKIAEAIVTKKPTIVFLQEILFQQQIEAMRPELEAAGYTIHFKPASHWRNIFGLIAGGLAILVKKEVTVRSVEFKSFSRQAAWNHVLSWSDAVLRKGVLLVDAEISGQDVRLISSHTLGAYNKRPKIEEYICSCQRHDIECLCIGKEKVIIGADLNTKPDQVVFTSLTDVLANQPDAITVDNQLNPFRQTKVARAVGRGKSRPNSRIDYLLVRGFTVVLADVTLDDPEKPLSDHWGIEAIIEI